VTKNRWTKLNNKVKDNLERNTAWQKKN
jgi:hypothetical protein